MNSGIATGKPVNAAAWLVWLVGVAAIPLVSRNPLYLLLCLATVLIVYVSLPPKAGAASAWRLFAVTGSVVALLSVGFNVLTVHSGNRTITTLPGWLPVIGGKLTYNALLYGISSALAISTLLFAAATFNTTVRHADLIRLFPASFARLGIAGSIALSFVPATVGAARDIYDAQRARGHRIRNVRDARGFIVPLFSTGLERALVLSEALETRGFGAPVVAATNSRRRPAFFFLAGAFLLLALILLANGRLLAGLLAVAGSIALMLSIPVGAHRRTSYRKTAWNAASLAVAAGASLPLLIVLAHFISGFSLAYEPFPVLELPPFNPVAGLALAGLLVPALWSRK